MAALLATGIAGADVEPVIGRAAFCGRELFRAVTTLIRVERVVPPSAITTGVRG